MKKFDGYQPYLPGGRSRSGEAFAGLPRPAVKRYCTPVIVTGAGQDEGWIFLAANETNLCDSPMPKGTFARPFNRTRSFRDVEWALPRQQGQTKRCPVENKEFDKYAAIELMESETTGEVQYYCPYCDELVIREFVSPNKRKTDIIDPAHT